MKARERGVVLINVLAVVALAATVLAVMFSLQETGLTRARLFGEAAQAQAIARGAEASAIAALRRDMIEAPAVDHAGEPWAAITERDRAIEGGTLTLTIADAQDRFNINALASGNALALSQFADIIQALELEPGLGIALASEIRAIGPVPRLEALALLGFAPEVLAALSTLVVALPEPAPVNLNSADEVLIAILLNNTVAATRLVAIRSRKGFVDGTVLGELGLILPTGAGYTSRHFRVVADVRLGEARQRLDSLVQRHGAGSIGGPPRVGAIARRWGAGER